MKALKTVWRVAAYPLLYLAIQIVVSGAYSLVAAAMFMFQMEPGSFMGDPFELIEAALGSMDLQLPLVISLALTLMVIYFIKRREWALTRFWRMDGATARFIPVLALIGVGSYILVSVVIFVTNAVDAFPEYEMVSEMLSSGSTALQMLGIGLLAPVCEEVIFRGIVMDELSQKIKLPFAVLISALIFGVVHLNVLQGLYAFVLGVVLSLVYIWRRSIWAPIVVHIAFNAFSVLLTTMA